MNDTIPPGLIDDGFGRVLVPHRWAELAVITIENSHRMVVTARWSQGQRGRREKLRFWQSQIGGVGQGRGEYHADYWTGSGWTHVVTLEADPPWDDDVKKGDITTRAEALAELAMKVIG